MLDIKEQKDISDVLELYIDNKYNYPTNFTKETVDKKNEEIRKIVSDSYYSTITQARPYYGVVKFMTISNNTINMEEDSEDTVTATLEVFVSMLVGDNLDYSRVKYTTKITLRRDANRGWVIIDDIEEGELLNEPRNENDDLTTHEIAERVVINYIDELDKHKNIKYMFKGAPIENPFETEKDVYIDTYNLLYWLYKKEDVELQYPININYFFTEGYFYTIFGKGHKYKVDISKFEIGDILFFGRSDTNIGIYIDNNEFISLRGTFPKDNTSIGIYKLDDYWDEFNGRVMRFDERAVY